MNRNFNDIINLLSKNARPGRIFNATKVIASYYYSKLTKKPHHWGLPISFSIEPTTSCNLRCPQCPSGLRSFNRPTGMLSLDLFKKSIDALHKTSGYVTLYFQGEPYLNKDFSEMVAYANSRRLYTATSSNAHYFNKENAEKTVKSGLDRIIISIDGTDQETYAKYRKGGNLEKVLSGTKELVEAKKRLKSRTPHIIWQFIVFAHNEHQIKEVKAMAKSYQVDELALKTAQIYDYETGSELIPSNATFSRYIKEDNNRYEIKNKLLDHCWRLWNSCVITWDGNVVPCCFDKDGTYQLGNLSSKNFREIWNGDNYNRFRSQILKGRKHIDICKNCSEGTSVWKS